jgi:large subunit ribosomal protein L23
VTTLRTNQDVILAPVISEKAYDQQQQKKFRFRVHPTANKVQIRKAIEQMFPGAKVAKVNTSYVPGKKRLRGRIEGRTPGWKKATITLRAGDIDLFEQV